MWAAAGIKTHEAEGSCLDHTELASIAPRAGAQNCHSGEIQGHLLSALESVLALALKLTGSYEAARCPLRQMAFSSCMAAAQVWRFRGRAGNVGACFGAK